MKRQIENHQYINLAVVVWALLLFLTGCGTRDTTTPAPSAPVSLLAPTQTPKPTAETITPSPTKESPTATITASLTPTVELITSTLVPTLPAEEAQSLVLDLLQSNGGCRFPCVWGLNPGRTSAQEAQAFLASLGSIDTMIDYGVDDRADFEFNREDLRIHLGIGFSEDSGIVKMLLAHAMGLRLLENDAEGAGVFSDSATNPLLQYYTPSQILSNYGPPSKVLIGGFYDDRGPLSTAPWKLSVVMDYSGLGFLVEYLNFGTGLVDRIVGCPSQAWDFTVWFWPTEEALSLEAIVSSGSGGINRLNVDWFKPIEEATSMTVDEFYQTFKDPQNTSCLETPVELWRP